MENQLSTAAAIDNLVAALGPDATARQKHVYREALRNLVRLAKTEYRLEMKTTVDTVMMGALPQQARLVA